MTERTVQGTASRGRSRTKNRKHENTGRYKQLVRCTKVTFHRRALYEFANKYFNTCFDNLTNFFIKKKRSDFLEVHIRLFSTIKK